MQNTRLKTVTSYDGLYRTNDPHYGYVNGLERIIKVLPFFQIFAGRDSYRGVAIASASYNATTYDWNLYHESVMAIAPIKRERLEQIALKASLDTSGEERKFWECVYNAL
ncbi:hypothetical protein [Vibrio hepatarius]|uniref:hypothetical protein n=1 Tax=Vibrio hepatarius TaxID=171383 RepID=UPI002090CC38|nr:hypothetical protein [Vibrio hepatarius]